MVIGPQKKEKKKLAAFDTNLTYRCQKKKKDRTPPSYTVSLFPAYHNYQIKSDKLERLNSNPNKKQVQLFIYFIDHWHLCQD